DETQLPFHAPHLRNQMLAELSPNPSRFCHGNPLLVSVMRQGSSVMEIPRARHDQATMAGFASPAQTGAGWSCLSSPLVGSWSVPRQC
ncbi:MAG: hypothetical protein AAFV19_25000, partial [Pseudomonadota bacterium]